MLNSVNQVVKMFSTVSLIVLLLSIFLFMCIHYCD